MRCISKDRLKFFSIKVLSYEMCAGFFLLSLLFANGCGQKLEFEDAYQLSGTIEEQAIENSSEAGTASGDKIKFFAEELCIAGPENLLDESISENLSEAAGAFDIGRHQVAYGKNIQEKLYPASTTKILTAIVALKYGELEEIATVSEAALDLEAGSSVCELAVGDQISLEQLLYGLLMESGNDAAKVIAELISDGQEEFAALMNEEAQKMGAVQSHFVNPHGLHDEEHYTTVYDLYLIMNQAVRYEKFVEIIKSNSYIANYKNINGEPVEKEWQTTNRYLTGEKAIPENMSVIGGKTGTTNAAGYCLVLYSENADGTPYISIVLKAGSSEELYTQMSEILGKIQNSS